MQVEELFDLMSWIGLQINDLEIIQKYRTLHKVLDHNAKNQQQQAFEEQKDSLIEALSNVQTDQLSIGQLEILETLDIAKYLGKRGIDFIEENLFRNALDKVTAANNIGAAAAKLEEVLQWSTDLRSKLDTVIAAPAIQEFHDQAIMRIHFTREAQLSNVTEFKDWGKTWYDIGRGVSYAHGHAPEEVSIIGASKGSIILTLAAIYPVAKTISMLVMDVLKLVEKVHQIRKTAEEVRALRIANDQAEALVAKADEAKQNGIQEITDTCAQRLEIDPNGEGDKLNELSNAIKLLAAFLDKGGEIDFVVPDENEDAEAGDENVQQRAELRNLFSEVRQLESEVRQLEDMRQEDDEG